MKFLKQFSLILLFSFLGEVLHVWIPLPIPASVYGLVLLLAALVLGICKLEYVKNAAEFLIEIMPVMFIPAAVGILTTWELLRPVWIQVVLITVITTVLVMVVTGRVTQAVIEKNKRKDKEEK